MDSRDFALSELSKSNAKGEFNEVVQNTLLKCLSSVHFLLLFLGGGGSGLHVLCAFFLNMDKKEA